MSSHADYSFPNGRNSSYYLNKGHSLLAMIAEPFTPQSPYDDFEYLQLYGWRRSSNDEDPRNRQFRFKCYSLVDIKEEGFLTNIYAQLDLSTEPEDNVRLKWSHSLRAPPPPGWSRTFEPTAAYYEYVFNPFAIVLEDAECQNDVARDARMHRDDVVPLQHLSDVTFLAWQQYCKLSGLERDNLEAIIHLSIVNDDTGDVVKFALARHGLSRRGSVTFDVERHRDHVMAILAIPNGASAAYLLAEHKFDLGNMEFAAITVWWKPDGLLPNLCFHVQQQGSADIHWAIHGT